MSQLDYSDVVERLTQYYGVSSQAAWDTINAYDLTPAQAANLLPQMDQYIYYGENGVGEIADGVYKYYNNAGDVIGYNQVATVPMGDAQLLPINSNAQSGTAQYAVKTQFAGNSVIDQNGKIKTSSGIPKYSNGSLIGNILATEVSPAAIIPAIGVATAIGKGIDSLIYDYNPTFWDSIGLSTLNPQTWNSITAKMGNTGIEGLGKKAINMLLHLDGSTGNTQAYLNEDAFNYMVYALAKSGMLDSGETTYTIDTSQGTFNPSKFALQSPVKFVQSFRYTSPSGIICEGYVDDGATIACIAGPTKWGLWAISQQTGKKYHYRYIYPDSTPDVTGTYNISITMSYTYQSVSHSYRYYEAAYYAYTGYTNIRNEIPFTESTQDGKYQDNGYFPMIEAAMYRFSGTPHSSQTIPGVSDQDGATVPTGIDSSSSQQDVADAIRQQYPDLYNNRLERDVVQDDGTVKKIIYYPVPMPNGTTDTEVQSDTPINIDQPVTIVLPEGETITLPDGSTVTGDGVTPITLPPGQYTLPSGTTITNNYIYNITQTEGGSQADPTVTDDSSDELKNLITSLITLIKIQSLEDTKTQDIDDTTEPNPPDTGDGSTPPVVVPVGSASRLWSVYNPTLAEINSFGAWLWSNNFVDQLLKLFNDPMQAIIGLHKTYIPPITGSAQNIQVGYLDSGVSALTVPTQYSTVDCGSVRLDEYFGNVFDYSPYTRVFIYLPFIGFKELDVSQVMRSSIGVRYHGDAYTGTGLAEISVSRDGSGGVLYSFGCECAVRYPLSQGSYMGFATAVAGLAVGVASGSVIPSLLGFAHGSGKPAVERSGAFSGNSGAMGIKKPYLVVMRPQTAMPRNYQHFSGAPSSSLIAVGEASGLIRVRECHVEQIQSATKEEKNMIETALREGIIV